MLIPVHNNFQTIFCQSSNDFIFSGQISDLIDKMASPHRRSTPENGYSSGRSLYNKNEIWGSGYAPYMCETRQPSEPNETGDTSDTSYTMCMCMVTFML